ncbi:FkbM family methyltransferase [Jiangella endophytica]|uniref:FkbM family methyltransferase n=1 Tax=Jiangella endophytica TaxID=1623398 RepID=UPI000E35296C|nr:FkbM family methyltransferase [Jiangella endophytica]
MRLRDLLAAQSPDAVRVEQVRTDAPLDLAWLDDVPAGGQVVLLIDALPAEPVARDLAVALGERGFELLHAVYLDDGGSLGMAGGLSLRRAAAGTAGLPGANLRAVTADGGPDWVRARAAFGALATRYESAAQALAAAEAARGSASGLVGRAAAELVRQPVRNARRSAGLLRAAWRAHRRPGAAARTGRAWLEFDLPMPVPPDTRPRAAALHVDLPSSSVVARDLRDGGIGRYEASTLPWFLALCDVAPAGAVWDVGANIGVYALLARAYSSREVVAFEPTPDLAAWARRLAAGNGLGYRLEQLAAGAAAETATLYLSEVSDSSNSLARGFRASKRQLDVLVEPLDRYARRTGSVPAVVKVDTETTEHLVLSGAREVLARHRPWIICEVLAGRAPERVLTGLMGGLGYRFHQLDGAIPPPARDVVRGDPAYAHLNYLFAPAPLGRPLLAAATAWAAALAATPSPGGGQGRPSPR